MSSPKETVVFQGKWFKIVQRTIKFARLKPIGPRSISSTMRKEVREERRESALLEAVEDETEGAAERLDLVTKAVVADLIQEIKSVHQYNVSERQVSILMQGPDWAHVDRAVAALRKYDGFAVQGSVRGRRQFAS